MQGWVAGTRWARHELPSLALATRCINIRTCLVISLLQSGAVDECGVCDGMGNSCAVDMALSITVSPQLIHTDSIEVGGVGGQQAQVCGRLLTKAGPSQQISSQADRARLQPHTAAGCVVWLPHLLIRRTPALPACPVLQEAPLEAFLANLTDALQLPPGSLTLDSLQQAGASTSDLAISSSSATGTKRLLLAGGGKPQTGPVHLTATLTLYPDSAEAAGGDAQLSGAWMDAVLGQVIAEQPASDPVQLDGVEALARWVGAFVHLRMHTAPCQGGPWAALACSMQRCLSIWQPCCLVRPPLQVWSVRQRHL